MSSSLPNRLSRGFGEVLFIVAGVLAALLVDDWRERRNETEAFEQTLQRVYTDVKKERFEAMRFQEQIQQQAELIDRMLNDPGSIADDVLPYALFYLDLPGADYFLSPAAAALREQVDMLMINANTPRELQVVKDLMDYTASTWARQDQRWVETMAQTGPERLRPTLLAAGLRDPALVWGYSGLNEFINARAEPGLAFTPAENVRARELLADPQFVGKLQTLSQAKMNFFYANTRTRTVDSLLSKIRDAYPGLQPLFKDLSIVGTAVSSGDTSDVWGRSVRMEPEAGKGSRWTLERQLTAGQVKFRTGDTWDENWGGLSFPDGRLSWFGDNIEVPSAGRYRITADLEAESYSFERLGD
jgi:hypothetical protein